MTITFHGPLLRYVGFQREVQISATTVQDSLEALCHRFPDLQPVLFDGRGALRPVHRLALNHSVLPRTQLNLPVRPEDTIDVITAIAGG